MVPRVPLEPLGSFLREHLSRDFNFGVELGRGSFGVVYAARSRGAVPRALAVKVQDVLDKTSIEDELRCHETLAEHPHENVLHAIARHHDVRGGKAYFVMQACAMNLATLLQSQSHALESGLAAECGRQVARGLAHVHKHGILHRDLKPADVLVHFSWGGVGCVSLRFLIADFGSARHQDARGAMTAGVMTAWYRAPEAFDVVGRAEVAAYGFPVDVWSLGCVFGELCHGVILFQAPNSVRQVLGAIRARLGEPTEGEVPDGMPALAAWPQPASDPPLPALVDLPSLSGLQGMAELTRACLRWHPRDRVVADTCAAILDAMMATKLEDTMPTPGADGAAAKRHGLSGAGCAAPVGIADAEGERGGAATPVLDGGAREAVVSSRGSETSASGERPAAPASQDDTLGGTASGTGPSVVAKAESELFVQPVPGSAPTSAAALAEAVVAAPAAAGVDVGGACACPGCCFSGHKKLPCKRPAVAGTACASCVCTERGCSNFKFRSDYCWDHRYRRLAPEMQLTKFMAEAGILRDMVPTDLAAMTAAWPRLGHDIVLEMAAAMLRELVAIALLVEHMPRVKRYTAEALRDCLHNVRGPPASPAVPRLVSGQRGCGLGGCAGKGMVGSGRLVDGWQVEG